MFKQNITDEFVNPLLAAIDISAVQSAIVEIQGKLGVIGAGSLGIAVIFMGYKVVQRAIAFVSGEDPLAGSDSDLEDREREDRASRGVDEYGDDV